VGTIAAFAETAVTSRGPSWSSGAEPRKSANRADGCQGPGPPRSLVWFWRGPPSPASLSFCSPDMLPFQEVCVEAHVPTEQPTSCQEARVPCPDEHAGRTLHPEIAPGQGPAPSLRLIGRFCGRTSFERVARSGSRARAGVLWCTYVLDPLVSPPQVAYAVGRATGTAVVRNRLRRRLRALLTKMDPPLGGGLYLFGVTQGAAQRSFDELAFDLSQLMIRMQPPPQPRPLASTPG